MIEISRLCKTYHQAGTPVEVLRELDLFLASGDFLALMGTSGAGKTTLLQVLGCLDKPSSGSYRFQGRETAGMDEAELARMRNQCIGFVFQSSCFIDYLDLLDNVALPGFYARRALAGNARERAEALLEKVGIAHRRAHTPARLSGGEKQRAAIARALFNNPALLLADEPTGNLDPANTSRIMDLLQTLNDQGITILMVTHDRGLACRAGRRTELVAGKLSAC